VCPRRETEPSEHCVLSVGKDPLKGCDQRWHSRLEKEAERHGTRTLITLAVLQAAFEDAGEDLRRDLSAVHIAVVRDCHYDLDLTLEVSVFGREEEEPLHREIMKGTHHAAACDEVERIGGVTAGTVLALFEDDLLAALAHSGHGISVNPGWGTEASLDPAGEGSRLLELEEC
jgi:hypothetical protein